MKTFSGRQVPVEELVEIYRAALRSNVPDKVLIELEDALLKHIAEREVARKAVERPVKKEESVVGVLTFSDIWANKKTVVAEFGFRVFFNCIWSVMKTRIGFKATTFLNIAFSKITKG